MKQTSNKSGAALSRWGLAALALISTYLLFHGAIVTRARSLLDPYSFSGDALQHIPPLWYAHERSLFSLDYIRDYYWKALFPPLFKATYWVVTLFAEPASASKIVSCALSILFVATITRTSYVLAGRSSAFISLVLATGGTLKNFPFMSGLQRGFGTWLCALMLLLVVQGNILGLCTTIVLTAMFYPAAAVFGLIALGLILCLPERFLGRGAPWTIRRRFATMGLCGVLTSLSVLPQLRAGSLYGERLSIEHQQEFAEWGPLGRYTQGDRGVTMPFWQKFHDNTFSSLMAGKLGRSKHHPSDDEASPEVPSPQDALRRNFLLTIFASLVCALLLARRTGGRLTPEVVRICAYLTAVGVSFAAATLLFPLLYIPTRYVVITLPALVPLIFPALWTGAVGVLWGSRAPRLLEPAAISMGMVALAFLGWFSLAIKPMPTASGHRELFSVIKALPRESVIVGWPRGAITTVSLFTGRNVLLHEEAHQIFHRNFLEECRRRMRAIIKLYSSPSQAAVDELRRDYGATHILLDRKHLKNTPSYFAPYQDEILAARAAAGATSLYLEQAVQDATIFRLQNLILIDLTKLPPAADNRAAQLP